jgi:hypothetical protein
MIAQPAPKGMSKKLSPTWGGPWVLTEAAGGSGLSFACRMMGRSRRLTTQHVSNMKPFHLRPDALETDLPHALLTAEDMKSLAPERMLASLIAA